LNAVLAPAKLIALGRVNSPQANARPVNLYGVAVNDAGLPGKIICEHCRSAKTSSRDKQRRERETSERHFERPNPFSANVLTLCKRICSA
jgi:hypothetical protein